LKTDNTAPKGLEDVIIGSSTLTLIDGHAGTLSYRGYDISDLAENATFEETSYLLLYGDLPNVQELRELRQNLSDEREIPTQLVELLRGFPSDASPMDILRTSISALSIYDPDLHDYSPEAMLRRAIRILSKTTTMIAAYERIRNGTEVIPPRADLDHASNFLYMMRGDAPEPAVARIFDKCLILHADHELNASTFAARVTASTLSDVYSAVTSAIGALKGPLHGGANEAVMEMLEEIKVPEKVEAYLKKAFSEKKRVMGFGHRVYKTIDPRATILRALSKELATKNGGKEWFRISYKLEEIMRTEKKLSPNVDFYAASVYHMLGIPTYLFTPIFAASRVTGWTAHIMEQYTDNRLIRPRADYVGHHPRKYIPLTQRK
jgi:citrate synthase